MLSTPIASTIADSGSAPPAPLPQEPSLPAPLSAPNASIIVDSGSAALNSDAVPGRRHTPLVATIVVLSFLLLILSTIITIGCYLSGRCFGSEAKLRRLPSIRRRGAAPRMRKVTSIDGCGLPPGWPPDFGLPPEDLNDYKFDLHHSTAKAYDTSETYDITVVDL